MVIHIVTRCSKEDHLERIYQSIEYVRNRHIDHTLQWHVLIDKTHVYNPEFDFKHQTVNTFVTYITKQEGDTYLHDAISKYCSDNITSGWITFIDDDNLLHENYIISIEKYLTDPTVKYIVNHQDNNYQVFTNIKIREGVPSNMKTSQVDLAQVTFHHSVFKYHSIGMEYIGDSIFIEKQYEEFPDEFRFTNTVGTYYNKCVNTSTKFLPTILYIGQNIELIKTSNVFDYSEHHLNIMYRRDDTDLKLLQSQYDIDLYVTEGHIRDQLTTLINEPIQVRRKWIEVDKDDPYKGNNIYNSFIATVVENYDKKELISIFTSTYNTGKNILKTYHSLVSQSYPNWEWVIVDDSTNFDTFQLLQNIAKNDSRVKLYSFNTKTQGNIGEAKYRAAMLCTGELLVELDHDDYLLPDACYHIIRAFSQYPEAGFFYSDSVELNKDYSVRGYGPNWAFGYGMYREDTIEFFGRRRVNVPVTPSINPKTVRHIVGVPNHVRVWNRKFYISIGGHNRSLTVVDDYELIVRTFLNTRMVFIPLTLYVQMFDGNNSQDKCRPEISRRVDYLRSYYNYQISNRFNELGVKDWCSTEHDFLYSTPRFGEEEGKVNLVYTP